MRSSQPGEFFGAKKFFQNFSSFLSKTALAAVLFYALNSALPVSPRANLRAHCMFDHKISHTRSHFRTSQSNSLAVAECARVCGDFLQEGKICRENV